MGQVPVVKSLLYTTGSLLQAFALYCMTEGTNSNPSPGIEPGPSVRLAGTLTNRPDTHCFPPHPEPVVLDVYDSSCLI